MKLESNYISTAALGDIVCTGSGATRSCRQTGTTAPAPAPAPSTTGGAKAVFDFFKQTFLPEGQVGGRSTPAPSSSFTASGLLLPAVLVLGGVGLVLVLKKKKKG